MIKVMLHMTFTIWGYIIKSRLYIEVASGIIFLSEMIQFHVDPCQNIIEIAIHV